MSVVFLLITAWAVLGVFAACSAAGETEAGTDGAGAGNIGIGSATSSGAGGFDACAEASDAAKLVPVNMYILFDKSGSMAGMWNQVRGALKAFFMDANSAGLKVALRFFPHNGCDAACDANACSQPDVALAELTAEPAPDDTHEQALVAAIDAMSYGGGTPMSVALEGAFLWAESVLQSAPSEKAAVVLVTDGKPEDCNTSESFITGIVGDANASKGIVTFAVGLEGSSADLMTDIAELGGTTEAIFVETADVNQQLLGALEEIRSTSLACEYVFPKTVNGDQVDVTEVNVIYKSGANAEPITLGQVPNQEACTPDKAAWYYDNPADPTKIIVCDATCAAIQADDDAELEILFGCITIPA